jgi:hypothetical protein
MLQTDTVILNKYNEHDIVVEKVKVSRNKLMSSVLLYNNMMANCNTCVNEIPFLHQFNDVLDAYICPIFSSNDPLSCL